MASKDQRTLGGWAGLMILGLAAGFLSGMFGVGGGILVVPGLMAVAGFSQRLASGTSLAVIVPLASVGVITYATHGSVSWTGALLLAAGAMVGSQIGTWLLVRIPPRALQIFFGIFVIATIVSLFLVVPDRDAEFHVNVLQAVTLAILGLITGTLAGLLGIGGGIVVVPALMLIFGTSDLVARGTSLLMMIPAAVTGTIANSRRKNVDLLAAIAVALPACLTTFLGSKTATMVSPELANTLFAVFLAVVAARLLIGAFRK